MPRKKSTSGRKYGPKASKDVERAMSEKKRGALHSGRSGKKVTSDKQAVAIGLSQARREGARVPRQAARTSRSSKKAGSKKTPRRKNRSS